MRRLLHRALLPLFEARGADDERGAVLDARPQVGFRDRRQREVHGDLRGVQTLAALVGQRDADRGGADELAGIAAEQSVTGFRDGADQHEIVGFEDAAQHGPAHPARRTENGYLQQLATLPSARKTL